MARRRAEKGIPRYSRTFERHRDAQGWATDLEAAIGRRDLAEVRRLTDDGGGGLRTVADLVDKFVTDIVETPGRRANQVASEKPRLARIRDDLGKLTLEMLSPQDVAAWRDKRLKSGAGAQTVRHDLNQLSVVLTTAISGMGRRARTQRRARREEAGARTRSRPTRLPGGGRCAVGCCGVRASQGWSSGWSRHEAHHHSGRRDVDAPGGVGQPRMEALDLERRIAHLPKTKNGDSRTVALSSVAVAALKTMQDKLREDGRVFDWARGDSFSGRFRGLVKRARRLYEGGCAERGETPDPHVPERPDVSRRTPRGDFATFREGPESDGGRQHDWA